MYNVKVLWYIVNHSKLISFGRFIYFYACLASVSEVTILKSNYSLYIPVYIFFIILQKARKDFF